MRLFFRQGLYWLAIYFLWVYMKSYGGMEMEYFQLNLVNVFIFMMVYYVLKYFQIPYFYNKGKTLTFLLSIIGFSFLYLIFWRTSMFYIEELINKPERMLHQSISLNMIETIQFYVPAVALLAWESLNDRRKQIERMQALEREKIANELKFLKAQINPHFLFNTLNNLYSSVVTKSPKAPDMILQLSGILDYVLYKSQKKIVSLDEEVKTIEHFLKLEQIRYGERLQIEFKKGANLSLPVSPLILLSIVENAFKHGASGDIDSPKIKIDIQEKNDSIHCEVWNTKSKYQGELNDAYKKGIGLSNIKRQLNLIYPDNHELIIEDGEMSFNVLLIIKTGS